MTGKQSLSQTKFNTQVSYIHLQHTHHQCMTLYSTLISAKTKDGDAIAGSALQQSLAILSKSQRRVLTFDRGLINWFSFSLIASSSCWQASWRQCTCCRQYMPFNSKPVKACPCMLHQCWTCNRMCTLLTMLPTVPFVWEERDLHDVSVSPACQQQQE